MKKTLPATTILITCFLLSFGHHTFSQGTLLPVRTAMENVYNSANPSIPANPPTMIVSSAGLNAFFGKKVAYYLSGSQNLSLYKTYFILDSDGKLFLAYNFTSTKKNNGNIKYLSTVGLKANVEDGFSSFFKNGEKTGDIGFSYRGTYFFNGLVDFDGTIQAQKRGARGAATTKWDVMRDQRMKIVNRLKDKSRKEEADFDNSMVDPANTTYAVNDAAAQTAEFQTEMLGEYLQEQAELEADALIEKRAYNWIRKAWISFAIYVPVTRSKYTVAPNLTSTPESEYFFPWQLSASYNMFFEGGLGTLYFSVGGTLENVNTISAELDDIEEIETTDYKNLGGADTLKLANVNSSKVYVGEYDSFFTPRANAQVVVFPGCLDFSTISLGVSASAEVNTGKYDPLNLKFGLPIKLDSDEDGKPVNIELRGEFFDYNGTVTGKSPKNNFSFGLAVGLPFSSLIR